MPWQTRIDPAQPWWADYLPLLRQLDGNSFPGYQQLNTLLPDGLTSAGGQPIRFVPSTGLGDAAYEQRIYTTGQVSTRPDNWHDLFNALVWARFPALKTAMNALHNRAWSQPSSGSRGHVRDALTLFDECGVIVFSAYPELLAALAQRNWPLALQQSGACWGKEIQIAVSGHAMLEKFLSPYKSMTAKALLVRVNAEFMGLPSHELLSRLDGEIAGQLTPGKLLARPACLAPLPLTGIPGWWPKGVQDDRFYHDKRVFRPPPAELPPAPITRLC